MAITYPYSNLTDDEYELMLRESLARYEAAEAAKHSEALKFDAEYEAYLDELRDSCNPDYALHVAEGCYIAIDDDYDFDDISF